VREGVSDESTSWRPALFKGKEVLVLCDAEGAVMLDRGRVPMKYKAGHERIYHAATANVTDTEGLALRRSALPAPHEASAAAARARPGSPLPSPLRRRTPREVAAPPTRELPADAVRIYTDGACSGNPGGPAALGVVVEDGASRIERGEYLGDSGTNNLAELTAILRGLELAPSPNRTTVLHTDSKYALGVLIGGWKAKVHLTLIARIKERIASFRFLELVYVPGHSGIPGNERADELARRAIQVRGDVDASDERR
jgi:ribonuclease HI